MRQDRSPPGAPAQRPAPARGEHKRSESRPGDRVDELVIDIPLPVYRAVPGGTDQHVPQAEENRDGEPGGEETDGGRRSQSHETIFASREAEGNSANARIPFVTRMSPFVTDREPLSELTPLAEAQTAADSTAIRATALDYIDGWYSNNATRMERALHPKLAKRMVWSDSTGKSHLGDLTAGELVRGTKSHPPAPAAKRRKDVQILSVFGNAAVVRIDAQEWVDYLQQIKWNGSWKIINVVWENRPESPALVGRGKR